MSDIYDHDDELWWDDDAYEEYEQMLLEQRWRAWIQVDPDPRYL